MTTIFKGLQYLTCIFFLIRFEKILAEKVQELSDFDDELNTIIIKLMELLNFFIQQIYRKSEKIDRLIFKRYKMHIT